jgi:hypothetical protein
LLRSDNTQEPCFSWLRQGRWPRFWRSRLIFEHQHTQYDSPSWDVIYQYTRSQAVADLVLGSEAFAQGLRRGLRGKPREQAQLKALVRPVTWPQIVSALEQVIGEPWADFSGQHGDWVRDAALWLGRRQGRLGLAELGNLAGGTHYAAVGQAVSRFGKRLKRDSKLQQHLKEIGLQLSHVEM